MPTDQDQPIDPSETTPAKEPPSPSDPQPSPTEPTETVEALKEKLAAAELEAKRWKGRVEKATEKKPDDTRSQDLKELEWKLENKERIKLVEDEYNRLLVEGYQGEKVSQRIALELAEKHAKIDTTAPKRQRQDDISTPSVTTRNTEEPVYLTEYDKRMGLTEKKKRELERKYPHLKEPI